MIETKSKILQNALAFADQHKSKYTGFIHYKNDREPTRDVVPIIENMLYGVALVSTLSKEQAEAGLAHIERLFHFSTEHGFCGYIHDFPNVYEDKTNVFVLLILSYFLKQFSKVIPSSNRIKIEQKRDELVSIIKKRELNPIDQYIFDTACFKLEIVDYIPKSLPEYETLVLCKLLRGERVELPWHKDLRVYTGPLIDTFYSKQTVQPSLFSQLAEEDGVHVSALYASLLPKNSFSELISFPQYDRKDLFINHHDEHLSIHFDNHSIVAQGLFDLQVCEDHITVLLDEFEEISFYLSDSDGCKVLIDEETATAFYPNQTIKVQAENKTLTLSFTCGKHPFVGHVMKGNRTNQLLDTNRNFAIYDHKIHLRRTFS